MHTRAQYDQLIQGIITAADQSGFESSEWLAKNQQVIEDQIRARQQDPFIRRFDVLTHGTLDNYQEFVRTRDMKLLWARMNHMTYQLTVEGLYSKCRDRCEITGALLDYGYNQNRVTDHPYFLPSQDHIIPVNAGGNKFGDSSNIQVISQRINTFKSDSNSLDILKLAIWYAKQHVAKMPQESSKGDSHPS